MQKKQVIAALKAQYEDEAALQARLARFVNDGYDFRDIEIRWMMNYPRAGQKTAVASTLKRLPASSKR